MRSMMTSYCFGSSMRMPPIFTNSASTPSTFIELTFSTTAGGKVFPMLNKIPIFFIANPPSFCHSESGESPVRNLLSVEGAQAPGIPFVILSNHSRRTLHSCTPLRQPQGILPERPPTGLKPCPSQTHNVLQISDPDPGP